MIPPLFVRSLAPPLLAASFNITPNSSLPGSSQVTSFLGGIEQWAVYACLLGLIVGGASLWWGVQNGSINRTSVSQHKVLAAFAGAVIIGAGSTSFEMMRYVGDRFPLIPTPSWMENPIDPISIRDVLHYLVAAADADQVPAGAYDIHGPATTS